MIRIRIRAEDPVDSSILYDIDPFHHPDMSILSEEGLDSMSDVLKAMCVVTTFTPEDIAHLVDRYDTMFDDEHPTVEVFTSGGTGGSQTVH